MRRTRSDLERNDASRPVLDASNKPLTQVAVRKLADSLRNNKFDLFLFVIRLKLTFVTSSSTLRVLNLSNTGLTAVGMRFLCDALANVVVPSNVYSLNLDNNPVFCVRLNALIAAPTCSCLAWS